MQHGGILKFPQGRLHDVGMGSQPQGASLGGKRAGDAYGAIFESVLWPTWERVVRKRDTLDHVAYLEATQWLCAEEIEVVQRTQLQRLLSYAGTNVPYYRELFKKVGFDPRSVQSREDLVQIPVLTREIIRDRYKDLIDPAHRGRNLRKGTSGSTGVPLKFEYSFDSECWRQATKLRGYGWAGYRLGMPTLHYWGTPPNTPTPAHALKVRLDRAMKREVFVNCLDQSEAALLATVDTIRRVRPHVIICYTQACAQLARFITDRALRDWDDIPVICGAEAVLPADRFALTKAFGPGVFETYGARETMLIGAECEVHEGLHVAEENILVEVVTEGRAARPNESGDVVITDLHNFGMPFIRYLNGDVASFAEPGRCHCGRSLRRLESLEGRRADTMIDGQGNPLGGMVVHVLFSDPKSDLVRQFQVTQKATGDVLLKVVRGKDWDDEAFAKMLKKFRETLRGLSVQVEFQDAIQPSAGGKFRTIHVERA